MGVSVVSSTSGYSAQADAARSESNRVQLGKDDFLKLFVTELRYQNALEPVDDREMLAQMAQFSALEQVQNLSLTVEGLAKMECATQASALIGKTVTATSEDDEEITGVVSAVRLGTDTAYLVVGGTEVALSQVTRVS